MKKLFFYLAFLFFAFSSFAQQESPGSRYIFLFIGDGMGVAHFNAAQIYLADLSGEQGFADLSFTEFPFTGLATNYAEDRMITGSAASGTALATGHKTRIGCISVGGDGEHIFTPMTRKALDKGMKTAVISSVSIDHATPAAFYAHNVSRSEYFGIGHDIISSGVHFLGGGGLLQPTGTIDGVEVDLWRLIEENGYTHADTRAEIEALGTGGEKTIVTSPKLDRNMAMPFVIDSDNDDLTLAGITGLAIRMLENDSGFFIMVEGGKIDWACHANDAAAMIHEVIAFSDAVGVAVDFYDKHPDKTTIIVTADHETGGLTIGRGETGYDLNPGILKYQRSSYLRLGEVIRDFKSKNDTTETGFREFMGFLRNDFGLGHDMKIPLTDEEILSIRAAFLESMDETKDREGMDPLMAGVLKLMSLKAGLGWTSLTHTGVNVPVFAIGVGAEKFTGILDQTDISNIISGMLE